MSNALESTQASSIFCDDIREEINSKTTLVGLYGGQMLVAGAIPLVLPQLCYWVTLSMDPDNLPKAFHIVLQRYGATGSVNEIGRINFPEIGDDELPPKPKSYGPAVFRVQAQAALRMSPLPVEEDSTIRAMLVMEGAERQIGSLTISIVESLP